MIVKPLKPKKCRICRGTFSPFRPLQVCCTTGCAIQYATKQREKAQAEKAKEIRKELKAAKERIKSRGDYAREAQIAFNAWVRARDAGQPCISCGGITGKQNAGHYRSVGSCPELRFEPLNVHLQCEKCNSYLSGNLINYRAALIGRIGLDKVEWLEGKHEPKKYSADDFKAIKAKYKQNLKELL